MKKLLLILLFLNTTTFVVADQFLDTLFYKESAKTMLGKEDKKEKEDKEEEDKKDEKVNFNRIPFSFTKNIPIITSKKLLYNYTFFIKSVFKEVEIPPPNC